MTTLCTRSDARPTVRPTVVLSGLLALCTAGLVTGTSAAAATRPVVPHPVGSSAHAHTLTLTAAGTHGTPLPDPTAVLTGVTGRTADLTAVAKGTTAAAPATGSAVAALTGRTVASAGDGSLVLVTAPVTSSPITSSPVTSSPVTSSPVASSPVTSAPVVTAPVVTAPVVTAPVVTTPVVTVPSLAAGTAPALYMQLGNSPSDSDLVYASAHYTVAILNARDISAMKRLKSLNPAMTVLCYEDFSSMRSDAVTATGADMAHGSSPIGWNQAQSHGEAWFAHSAQTGKRIEWSNFANQYQAAVWNKDYQAAWVKAVSTEVVTNGWDGVMVDNYMSNLWYYYDFGANGPTDAGDPAQTNATIRQAEMDVTVGVPSKDKVGTDAAGNAVYANYGTLDGTRTGPKAIGPLLRGAGKLFIPSVSDGRQDIARWNALTQFGGGLEENWTHWNKNDEADVNSYFYDWDGPGSTAPSGWRGQQLQAAMPQATPGTNGLFLAVTSSRDGDMHASIFGLASFYMANGGRGAYTAIPRDGYNGFHLRPQQTWNIGLATAPAHEDRGTFTRPFTNGYVVVNPSGTRTVTVTVPAGYLDDNGRAVTTVTLSPVTGAVLRKA